MLDDEGSSIMLGSNKKFNKKKRNLKKRRKIQDEIEQQILNQDFQGENLDLKTREQLHEEQVLKAKEEQDIQKRRRENYNRATAKANLKTARMLEKDVIEDDDYELIQKSLERQRKQVEAKRTQKKTSHVEQNLMAILNESTEKTEENKVSVDNDFAMPMAKPPTQKGKVKEITDISQLSKDNIETEQDRRDFAQILKSSSDVSFSSTKFGTTSVVNVALPSERLQSQIHGIGVVAGVSGMNENQAILEEKIREEIKNKEVTEEEKQKHDELEEPSIGKGVARALQVFAKRNMLNQKSRFVGRNKDNKAQRDFEEEQNDEDRIRIVRTDKYGNVQTRKEAFRELCYNFHNIKPSQKKREKMQKKLLQAQKESNLISGTDTFFAKALQKEQKKKKKPYMVIDTKKPRSKIKL